MGNSGPLSSLRCGPFGRPPTWRPKLALQSNRAPTGPATRPRYLSEISDKISPRGQLAVVHGEVSALEARVRWAIAVHCRVSVAGRSVGRRRGDRSWPSNQTAHQRAPPPDRGICRKFPTKKARSVRTGRACRSFPRQPARIRPAPKFRSVFRGVSTRSNHELVADFAARPVATAATDRIKPLRLLPHLSGWFPPCGGAN